MCTVYSDIKYSWHWFTYRSSLHKSGQNPTQHVLQSLGGRGAKFKPSLNRCRSSGFSVFDLGAQCLPGRVLHAALCFWSREGEGGCPRAGRAVPGREHLSPAQQPGPRHHGSCAGQIQGVLSHLPHLLHKCCPSARIFTRSAEVATSLPLAQYLSCWNIFCVI